MIGFFYWVQICSVFILIEIFIRKDNEKNMLVIILSCKYVDENIIIKFKMNSLWKDHSNKIIWFVVSSFSIDKWRVSFLYCRNPTLAKCGGEAQHLEKVRIWSPPGLSNVQSSTARPKTPRIGVFLVSLKRFWSVDIENGLVLAIWTSVAQVMGKRRAESQTGSLTPDH